MAMAAAKKICTSVGSKTSAGGNPTRTKAITAARIVSAYSLACAELIRIHGIAREPRMRPKNNARL